MAWWTNYFPWLQFAQTLLEKPATCPSMRFLLQFLYPPTRTHTFARCSTGFTRKRVSCSNSDNEIIWTLGSPGQIGSAVCPPVLGESSEEWKFYVSGGHWAASWKFSLTVLQLSLITVAISPGSEKIISKKYIEVLLNAADLCFHTLLVRWSTHFFH